MGKRSRDEYEDEEELGPENKIKRENYGPNYVKKSGKGDIVRSKKSKKKQGKKKVKPKEIWNLFKDEEVVRVTELLNNSDWKSVRKIFLERNASVLTVKRWMDWCKWRRIGMKTIYGIRAAKIFADNEDVKLKDL